MPSFLPNFNQVLESFQGSPFHLPLTANRFANHFQELNLHVANLWRAMNNLVCFAQIRFLWVEFSLGDITQ